MNHVRPDLPERSFQWPYSIVCGMRYKTRPGLSYHYNHSHKDRDKSIPLGGYPVGHGGDDNAPSYHDEGSLGAGSISPPSTPGGGDATDMSGNGQQGANDLMESDGGRT
jgi:hypothetical protein